MGQASGSLFEALDSNGDGTVSMEELMDADVKGEPSTDGPSGSRRASVTSTADHRQLTVDDERIKKLVRELQSAVDSIPSYIERSSMTWVVVPPVAHVDLPDAVCDFASWRKRGWCRMEFAASKLACGEDMPLMVIRSENTPPEYFNPCDMFKLCAARGDYSYATHARERE